MQVRPHHTVEQIEALARREKTARTALRLRAVILAKRGRTAPEIAELLGRSRRAVQDWVRRYNRHGFAGLPDAPRPGQKKKLTSEQEAALCAWLDAGPPGDGPVCAYRGPEIRRHIESVFGAPFSVSGAYDLLHRLGYSPLRPRPRHRKADPEAQAAFKRSAPFL